MGKYVRKEPGDPGFGYIPQHFIEQYESGDRRYSLVTRLFDLLTYGQDISPEERGRAIELLKEAESEDWAVRERKGERLRALDELLNWLQDSYDERGWDYGES